MKRSSKKLGNFLDYSHHVTDSIIKMFNGDYLLMFKVAGKDVTTLSVAHADSSSTHLEAAYRSVQGHQVWVHTVRLRETLEDSSVFTNQACQDYNDSYVESFKCSYVNTNYISIVFDHKRITNSRNATQADLEAVEEITAVESRFLSCLESYGCSTLGRDGKFSEPLKFLRFLSSHEQENVLYPDNKEIRQIVSNGDTTIGTAGIELEFAGGSRFAKLIEIGDFPSNVDSGEWDELMTGKYEAILTQTFKPVSRMRSSELMRVQVAHLEMAGDKGVSQVEEITNPGGAMDVVDSGEMIMGHYSFTFEVYSDPEITDREAAHKNCQSHGKKAHGVLAEMGYSPAFCSLSNNANWFGRFPGMGGDLPQLDIISSDNFSDLAALHGTRKGKATGNPWGPNWTTFLNSDGFPYRMNLHSDTNPEDEFGELKPSSLVVIGTTGVGKSALVQHLFAQGRKFDPMAVMLDKDCSCEKAIVARDGLYLKMKSGQRTGLSPFQWEQTGSNLLFLDRLVASAAGGLTKSEEIMVSKGIRSVMELDKEDRSLSALMQNLTDGDSYDTSVKARLSQWCRDDGTGIPGPYWWVFDNETDSFDISGSRDIGIDVTEFLEDEKVGGIITSILLQKINGMIGNGRFILGVEEFANVLKRPVIAAAIADQLQTIRKKDGMVIMVSTSPADILASDIAKTVVQQTPNKVFMANVDADKHDYCEGFKCTDDEFAIIQSLDPASRLFLHKQTQSNLLMLQLKDVKNREVVGL